MKVRDKLALKRARAKRRGSVPLEDRAITAKTRSRYYEAVKIVLPLLERSTAPPDEIISQWIEEQYEEGEPITHIGDALSGLHHYAPWIKGSLQGAWRLFRLWRKVERPKQAAPLPVAFCEALVARFIQCDDLEMAAACCLGFWGLLRTGEILALHPRRIMLGQYDAVMQLGYTKTGLRRQQDENVIVRHQPTHMLLTTLLQIKTANRMLDSPLVQGGGPRFRAEFDKVLAYFDFAGKFRPYSLRRGGATADFRMYNSMERTLIRGRWGTSQAARQYIQEGLSVLTKISISRSQATLIRHYAQQFTL